MKTLFTFFLLLLLSGKIFAQAGILDSTFATNGVVLNNPSSYILYVGTFPNGKIVGGNDNQLLQYPTVGTADSSFSDDGRAIILNYGFRTDIALQTDGQMLISGQESTNNVFQIARYKTDGTLDSTFGVNGETATPSFGSGPYGEDPEAITLQTDGKIVQAGLAHDNSVGGIGVARYNSDGTMDNTFGDDGNVITQFNEGVATAFGIAVQSDGKIVAGGTVSLDPGPGSRFVLVRYNADGTLDNSFGGDGKVITVVADPYSAAYALALQPDGKIVMAGWTLETGVLGVLRFCRYNSDGSLDNSFGTSGIASCTLTGNAGSYVHSINLQPDGKIILVGYRYHGNDMYSIFLTRFENNGVLDITFGTNGLVETVVDTFSSCSSRSSALQSDGKLLVGYSCNPSGDGGILRYLTGLNLGVIDLATKENPILIYPNLIKSEATLEFTLLQNETISIELFDIQGKLVQTFLSNESRVKGSHKEELQFNNSLSSGNYILRIGNGNSYQAVKIIKQ